jgi:predicted nicotinamide N-methyase
VTETVAGYRVRRRPLPGLAAEIFVYEIEDEGKLLDDAVEDPAICPYGGVVWDSGAVTPRALLERGEPEVVVDVGCGVGPVALACAAAGCRAVALDKDPNARALTAAAAAAQDLEVEVGAVDLDSDEPLPSFAGALYVFADVLYEADLARSVARQVRALLARGDRVVVIDPGRYARAVFLEEARLPPEVFEPLAEEGALAWCWLPSA